jgi:O-antigen ligase
VRQFPGQVNEAHNGYLDVFLQLGVVGIVLLMVVVVSFYRRAREEFNADKDWGALRLAILIIAVAHDFTETSWLGDTMLLWNVFVCLAVVYPPVEMNETVVERVEAKPRPAESCKETACPADA